jgi:hypothetical protein
LKIVDPDVRALTYAQFSRFVMSSETFDLSREALDMTERLKAFGWAQDGKGIAKLDHTGRLTMTAPTVTEIFALGGSMGSAPPVAPEYRTAKGAARGLDGHHSGGDILSPRRIAHFRRPREAEPKAVRLRQGGHGCGPDRDVKPKRRH